MNVKNYRWVIVALSAAWCFLVVNSSQTIGIRQELQDGNYRITAGSAPWALGFAGVVAVLYICLMISRTAVSGQEIIGWWRRVAAFVLDFLLAMEVVAPLVGLIPIFAEWHRTGTFAWSFERTAFVPEDIFVFVSIWAIAIPMLLFYFTFPLVHGRPTPGACALGYQIIGDGEARITPIVALKRILRGVTFLGDRKCKIPRIDYWYRTRAVKLK